MTDFRTITMIGIAALSCLGILAYALRWLWIAMIAVAMLLHAYSAARAHSWYPVECCSDRDCYPLPDGTVKEVKGGYQLIESGEFIPSAETRDGRDDHFHICRWPDGRRICFFRPYSGT